MWLFFGSDGHEMFLRELAKVFSRKGKTHNKQQEKINERNFTFAVRILLLPAKILAHIVMFVDHLAEVPERSW